MHPVNDDVVPLPEELMLFEYQASMDPEERNTLYLNHHHFRPYWERRKWLELGFEQGVACVRATHYVGLMPFRCDGQTHLLMVAPKGCSHPEIVGNSTLGLLRFLEMITIVNGGQTTDIEDGFAGVLGRNGFVGILVHYYGQLLHELCRRDFRRYFRHEEDELHGRIRGRIRVHQHVGNTLRGRAHRIPCSWEEFTPDNWDNRILLGAMRSLQRSAALIAPGAEQVVRNAFRGLESWFSLVKEVEIRPGDFSKARLWRTSQYYRRAFEWARLIIQGMSGPAAGGNAPPLVIDANKAFERFVEVVAQGAANSVEPAWTVTPQAAFPFLGGIQYQARRPDLTVKGPQGIVAVGDAKYKDVLEQDLSPARMGDLENSIIPKLREADWNQLFVYMRLTNASKGFFIVPFWDPNGEPARLITGFDLAISPIDRNDNRPVRLAVVGLNLLRPLGDTRRRAVELLSTWLPES